MHEPDDFGLSPLQALAQVADATPPPGFVQTWTDWAHALATQKPTLTPLRSGEANAAGAPGVSHTFVSRGEARVGCRLIAPKSGKPRGAVVTTHGYEVARGAPIPDENPWSERGLAVLRVRVRGFPGSQFDTGDLTAHPTGYITIGLEDRRAWVLFDAVADVINAVRALHAHLGDGVPIALHGESFGAGLAVMAASVLPLEAWPCVQRLALALPTFGWWTWRLEKRPRSGTGGLISDYIAAMPQREEEIRQTLRLGDAVVHARRITSAVLCKLAERDDVVPAPTAAAVFNALGSDPGRKWRFLTRYGHFDGGIADQRRHAMFERLVGKFLDPGANPASLMKAWEPVLSSGERAPAGA